MGVCVRSGSLRTDWRQSWVSDAPGTLRVQGSRSRGGKREQRHSSTAVAKVAAAPAALQWELWPLFPKHWVQAVQGRAVTLGTVAPLAECRPPRGRHRATGSRHPDSWSNECVCLAGEVRMAQPSVHCETLMSRWAVGPAQGPHCPLSPACLRSYKSCAALMEKRFPQCLCVTACTSGLPAAGQRLLPLGEGCGPALVPRQPAPRSPHLRGRCGSVPTESCFRGQRWHLVAHVRRYQSHMAVVNLVLLQ